MNYLQPERLDRLAREYVLGTLTGRARRRFERVLQQAPSARRAVGAWQERFGVLAAGVPAMSPREQVWRGLEERLFAPKLAPPARAGWFERLFSGRTLGGALAGVLLAVGVVRMQPSLVGLQPPVQDQAPEGLPASYVGLLTDPSGQPTLLASSRRHGRVLTVKVLRPVQVPAGQVAQLWAFRQGGGAPFPVAVLPPLPAARGSVTLTLPDTSEKLFSDVVRLAVTVQAEPATPAEPPPATFAFSGHCVKLW